MRHRSTADLVAKAVRRAGESVEALAASSGLPYRALDDIARGRQGIPAWFFLPLHQGLKIPLRALAEAARKDWLERKDNP